jgi:RNA polymerase primary sigma factor
MREITSATLLSSDKQIMLCIRAQRGDKFSRDTLINSNIRFVINIARQYLGQGMDLADLVSEGVIGLIRAIDKFDPSMGNKFITYAGWWIRQSILQALNEHTKSVRIPLNKSLLFRKFLKEKSLLQQKYMRDTTEQEVLESLELDFEDMAHNSDTSIDEPLYDDMTSFNFLENSNADPPDSKLMRESEQLSIELMLKFLNKREREILKLYFGIGYERTHTLEEISDKFKLTRERIRQIKKAAIRKLRRMYKRKKFDKIL